MIWMVGALIVVVVVLGLSLIGTVIGVERAVLSLRTDTEKDDRRQSQLAKAIKDAIVTSTMTH